MTDIGLFRLSANTSQVYLVSLSLPLLFFSRKYAVLYIKNKVILTG